MLETDDTLTADILVHISIVSHSNLLLNTGRPIVY